MLEPKPFVATNFTIKSLFETLESPIMAFNSPMVTYSPHIQKFLIIPRGDPIPINQLDCVQKVFYGEYNLFAKHFKQSLNHKLRNGVFSVHSAVGPSGNHTKFASMLDGNKVTISACQCSLPLWIYVIGIR